MNIVFHRFTKELGKCRTVVGTTAPLWGGTLKAGKTIQTVRTRQAKASRLSSAEALVNSAAAALRDAGPRALKDFDAFPAPLYATDKSGNLLYFNPACVEFAGRTPTLNVDRWCVSWKLYASNGEAMAHDQCPMAVAIRNGEPVRGIEAFAERPDGGRTRFRPFPALAIDEHGRLIGAVNLIVPVDGNPHRDLLAKADKCRVLAKWVTDKQTESVLTDMAEECESHARALRLD